MRNFQIWASYSENVYEKICNFPRDPQNICVIFAASGSPGFSLLNSPRNIHTHKRTQHSQTHVSIDRTTFTPSSIDVRTHEHIWYCFCGSFALIIENDMCVVRTARTSTISEHKNHRYINHKLISAWIGRHKRGREKIVKNASLMNSISRSKNNRFEINTESNLWHVKCKCIQFHRVSTEHYWKEACVPKKQHMHYDYYTAKNDFRRICEFECEM